MKNLVKKSILATVVLGYMGCGGGGSVEDNNETQSVVSQKKYPKESILKKSFRLTDTSILKPAKGESVIDDVFGTKITQVNKKDNKLANYPKKSSWNSDMSLLYIGNRFYDGQTYEETSITKNIIDEAKAWHKLCGRSSSYLNWSSMNPNRFYVINHQNNFIEATINADNVDCSHVLDNFDDYELIHMGPYEGNIDIHDKYVVFIGKKKSIDENNPDIKIYVILYDIQNQKRVWTKEIPEDEDWWRWIPDRDNPNKGGWYPRHIDWISVSPSGKYILLNNAATESYFGSGHDEKDAMYWYDINFSNKTKLQYKYYGNHKNYSEGGHGDMGFDTDGNEVWVQFTSGVGVHMFNLDKPTELGKELLIYSAYGNGHISCRNIQRPGWCYVTTHAKGFRDVFAVKLEPDTTAVDDGNATETVELFSQTHLKEHFYETYGGVSPDGTKMIFNSYWESDEIGVFIAEVK